MDNLTRAYYEVAFERDFLKKKSNEFQDFFSEIMEKNHPGDFQRVRPWGKIGDRKNDGYLRSERTLFQVYAPNDMEASEAVKKITEDFHGALPYWKEYFDRWVFVHNARSGLGPEVTQKLLELDTHNKPVCVTSWGFEELRQRVFGLSVSDLASLLGPAPSNKEMINLRFSELQIVLTTVARQQPPPDLDIRPVPADKLIANALSSNVQILLTAGMTKADLVKRFFQQWHEPRFGDEIAEAFRKRYAALKSVRMPPDEIFYELQAFAEGTSTRNSDHQAAVLAVLAYFFEQCEIFEAPTGKLGL